MLRSDTLATNEYYHILGRGNNKDRIFLDDADYVRFMFLVLFFQSDISFPQVGRHISSFQKHGIFPVSKDQIRDIVSTRYVELVNFCIMPNHYHLTVFNSKEDKGISKYMQRVLTAYSKYFNTKYKQTGHVFQGPYKAVHISTDRQLQYLSTYIHKNPSEMKGANYKTYKWSSYQDYTGEDRWGKLLSSTIILGGFDKINDYKGFVESSPAKDKDIETI